MDNPKQWLLDFNNSDIGQNIMISGGLLGVLPCVFMLGLGDLLYAVWGIPRIFDNKDIYILCLIIFWILTSILLKNYKKYFKEFNKKPRKWKVRWAWISLAVVLFPFVFFFWAMSMMG